MTGGHCDHLGTDGVGTLDPQAAGEIRNGADDNASGTSGAIGPAEHIALTRPRPKRAIAFVANAGGFRAGIHWLWSRRVPRLRRRGSWRAT